MFRKYVGRVTMEEKSGHEKNVIRIAEEGPVTFGSFTSHESWDYFFERKGVGLVDWYTGWPELSFIVNQNLIHRYLPPPPREKLSILVPACGNSSLSECLYDDGFTDITNVDFSNVVLSAMSRRNEKERPLMRWLNMDMTNMQFPNGTFDAIIDKGGLDALMRYGLGPRSGILYISEVKRLLKAGGKYFCLTLGESHVLGQLFQKFRFGWSTHIYSIGQKLSSGTTERRTFMFVAEKSSLTAVETIWQFMQGSVIPCPFDEDHELYDILKKENALRSEYSYGADRWYSLEDLDKEVERGIRQVEPGRVVKVFLGEPRVSRFFYTGLILDGALNGPFHLLLFNKMQISQKLLVDELQQRKLHATVNAARLVVIVLDFNHSDVPLEDILKDISSFIRRLSPQNSGEPIYWVAKIGMEGIKRREIVHKVTSALTGPIIVEDVIHFVQMNDHDLHKDSLSRRLCFERTENLVHSEAFLSTNGPNEISGEVENMKVPAAFITTSENGEVKNFVPQSSDSHVSNGKPKVDHNFLATGFYKGVISGILLFSLHSERTTSADGLVNTVIIGLGAGLLPMFMRNYLPYLKIEVVEFDSLVLTVAKDFFGFVEDDNLMVHITDATEFIREKANYGAERKDSFKVDVVVIDVDSSDSSSGLISPEADFIEESFLLAVKDSLSDKGLFILKLISKFSTVKRAMYSRLRKVFCNRNLYHFNVDGDFVEIIFALKKNPPITAEDELTEACEALATSLQDNNENWAKTVLSDSKLIKPLPRWC